MADEKTKDGTISPEDSFWKRFNDARMNKSETEYCEMSIPDLRQECDGMKCFLKELKAKITRNSDCKTFDKKTVKDPERVEKLKTHYEKLRAKLEKAEQKLAEKEMDVKENAENYRNEKMNEKLRGWWDHSTIEAKKGVILGRTDPVIEEQMEESVNEEREEKVNEN